MKFLVDASSKQTNKKDWQPWILYPFTQKRIDLYGPLTYLPILSSSQIDLPEELFELRPEETNQVKREENYSSEKE